jgi:hypothetical protein
MQPIKNAADGEISSAETDPTSSEFVNKHWPAQDGRTSKKSPAEARLFQRSKTF